MVGLKLRRPAGAQSLCSRGSAWSAVFIGGAVLIGWAANVPTLVKFPTSGSSTLPNTAAGLILAGLALVLIRPSRTGQEKPSALRGGTSKTLGAVVLLLGVLTLAEYLFHVNLGIDRLLFRSDLSGGFAPGRPSQQSALELTLVGLALLTLEVGTVRGRRPAEFLALAVAGLSLLALGGHAHQVPELYRIRPHGGISLYAAVGFMVLSIAILTSPPARGLASITTSDGPAGRLIRVLAPLVVVLPLLPLVFTAWIVPRYEETVEVSMAALSTLLIGILIWYIASSMNRAEAERRRAEQKLSGVLESAPAGIVAVGPDGTIVQINSETERLFGHTREELMGRSIQMLVPERLRASHAAEVTSFFSAGGSRPMGLGLGLTGVRADGAEFPIDVSLRRVETEDGPLVIAAVRHIGEREEAISRLAAMVESADDAIIGQTLDGEIVTWNRGAEKIYGYTAGEIAGSPGSVLALPGSPDHLGQVIERIRRDPHISHQETTHVRKGGTPVHVSLTVLPIEGRTGIAGISTIAQDITEQRQAEQALAEAEARYRGIFDSAVEGIFQTTLEGRFIAASPASARMLGYRSTVELMAEVRNIGELFLDPTLWGDTVRQLRTRVVAPGLEAEVRTKYGDRIWVSMELRSLLEADGQTTVQGILVDITERKKVEEERRRQQSGLARFNAQLQEALRRERETAGQLWDLNETKNALLEAVSHDLKTPLASMRGFAEILTHHGRQLSASKRHELTERIAASARRLERLLSSLLDLDRLSRGVLIANRKATDIAELARQIVEDLDLTHHPVKVEGDAVAEVDPVLFERIVENLVMNAAEHTQAGKPIRVSVRTEPGGVLIGVDDRGPGIPERLKNVIFEPFRRGNAPDEVKGTGIGLHLVGRFAELHGGRAWVEDRPDGGASFRVFLLGQWSSREGLGLGSGNGRPGQTALGG